MNRMGMEDWEARMAKGGGRRGTAEVNGEGEGEGGWWRRGIAGEEQEAAVGQWRRGRGRRSTTTALDLGDSGDGEPTKERTREKRGGSDILVGEGEEADGKKWQLDGGGEEEGGVCNGSARSWGWRRWRADEGKNQREERRQRHSWRQGKGGGRQEAAARWWRRGRGRRFATAALDLGDDGDGELIKERTREKRGGDAESTKKRTREKRGGDGEPTKEITREKRGDDDILLGEGEEADGMKVHGVDSEG